MDGLVSKFKASLKFGGFKFCNITTTPSSGGREEVKENIPCLPD
jgi:hypothetical protein